MSNHKFGESQGDFSRDCLRMLQQEHRLVAAVFACVHVRDRKHHARASRQWEKQWCMALRKSQGTASSGQASWLEQQTWTAAQFSLPFASSACKEMGHGCTFFVNK